MWFDRWKKQKQGAALTPPPGFDVRDIATQSSVCTGETLVGFLDAQTGKLLQAVVVRSQADLDAFYRAYGYEPPRQK